MTKLSDTQRVILSRAAQHEAVLATPPAKLPAAARHAVLRSMIAKGLLEEVPAPREAIALGWRQDEDGAWIALRITTAGLAAIGVEPEATAHVPDAELGGLTPAEFEEEQELAQAALDAGIDLSLEADRDRPRDERDGADPGPVIPAPTMTMKGGAMQVTPTGGARCPWRGWQAGSPAVWRTSRRRRPKPPPPRRWLRSAQLRTAMLNADPSCPRA